VTVRPNPVQEPADGRVQIAARGATPVANEHVVRIVPRGATPTPAGDPAAAARRRSHRVEVRWAGVSVAVGGVHRWRCSR